MAGFLRITGGRLVRRRFNVPEAADSGLTRPTGDKVREAIFSSLGDKVLDARVLDLFAGSGAYGFEAISRGAKEVVLVEKSSETAKCIKKNIESLGLEDSCKVQIANVISHVARKVVEKYELVFVDPPYSLVPDENFWVQLKKWLDDESIVIFRCKSKKDFECPAGYQITRAKAYGGTAVFFLRLLVQSEDPLTL